LVCSVPAMQNMGDIHISAVVPLVSETTFGSLSFLVLKAPAVDSFYPRFAYPSGSFVISVHGINFSPLFETKCLFGDHASDAHFLSENALSCTTPIFSAIHSTPLTLILSTNEALSVGTVLVVPVPLLLSVSPSVVITPETTLTITGKYFKDIDDYVCAFGSNFSSAARVLTDYSVECQAPDLSRTTNFSVDLLHPYFQRLRGPSIQVSRIRVASIKPSAGPKTGGTVVTVFGENFDKLFHPLCVFGGSLYSGGINFC